MLNLVVSTAIFIITYIVIVTERIHKTVVVLVGAGLILLFNILTQSEAFFSEEYGIDYNVIFLLVGMMIIVSIMKRTGIFQFLTIWSAQKAKGDPLKILIALSLITAVLSAFLDNVTMIILIAPVTFLIADRLRLDPVPFLIAEVIASNIGGTATIIGDPPNIMVGSKALLGFNDFIVNLAPLIIVVLAVFIVVIRYTLRKSFKVDKDLKKEIMSLKASESIENPKLLTISLIILGLMIVGFVVGSFYDYRPATIAIIGAGLLLLFSRDEPTKALLDIEWNTIFFFIGLFIIVGGMVKSGIIRMLADGVINLTCGNILVTSIIVLWISAIFSALIDNVPYTAAMIPLVIEIGRHIMPTGASYSEIVQNPTIMPLWWALALGACLGGNGTIIGASANVIMVGISERAGHKITFMRFLKYGLPITGISIIISMIYLLLRYFVFNF